MIMTFVSLDDVIVDDDTHIGIGQFLTLEELQRVIRKCKWLRVEVCNSKANALIVNEELAC